jgi:hypothetical protein
MCLTSMMEAQFKSLSGILDCFGAMNQAKSRDLAATDAEAETKCSGIVNLAVSTVRANGAFDLLLGYHRAYQLGWTASMQQMCPKMVKFINQMHVIIPGKLYAVRNQKIRAREFAAMKVRTVIRLNDKESKCEEMEDQGVRCISCDFEGDIPSPGAVNLLFHAIQASQGGGIVLQCDGQTGRSLVLCAMHLMHGHGFRAASAMGWLRLACPGTCFSPSQADYLHFLDPSPAAAA